MLYLTYSRVFKNVSIINTQKKKKKKKTPHRMTSPLIYLTTPILIFSFFAHSFFAFLHFFLFSASHAPGSSFFLSFFLSFFISSTLIWSHAADLATLTHPRRHPHQVAFFSFPYLSFCFFVVFFFFLSIDLVFCCCYLMFS